MNHWLSDFAGAEDTDYTRAVGRKWMIGAVARAFKPGCKMDTVLILEGEQGIGKSKVFRILAGDEWFCDHIPDLSNKDAAIQLQGVWIFEHAELDSLSRSEVGQVKSFITAQTDRFRPPFGKIATDHPRSCVFGGSVNPQGNGYLKDPTGARRFWPVACASVDAVGLADARKQLLAEAVVAFRAGESWWLSLEMEAVAAIEQSERLEQDEWTNKIKRYLYEEYCDFVTVGTILEHCLGINRGKWIQSDQNRVEKCLKVLGWVPARKMITGVFSRGYRPSQGNITGSYRGDGKDPVIYGSNNNKEMEGCLPGLPGLPGLPINRVCVGESGDGNSHAYTRTYTQGLEIDPVKPVNPVTRSNLSDISNSFLLPGLEVRPGNNPVIPQTAAEQSNVVKMRRPL